MKTEGGRITSSGYREFIWLQLRLRLIDWGLAEFYHPGQEYNVRVASRYFKVHFTQLFNFLKQHLLRVRSCWSTTRCMTTVWTCGVWAACLPPWSSGEKEAFDHLEILDLRALNLTSLWLAIGKNLSSTATTTTTSLWGLLKYETNINHQ